MERDREALPRRGRLQRRTQRGPGGWGGVRRQAGMAVASRPGLPYTGSLICSAHHLSHMAACCQPACLCAGTAAHRCPNVCAPQRCRRRRRWTTSPRAGSSRWVPFTAHGCTAGLLPAFCAAPAAPEPAGLPASPPACTCQPANNPFSAPALPQETLKYFYLLFAPDSALDLTKWVMNTEAHPLRAAAPKGGGALRPQLKGGIVNQRLR